MGQTNFAPFFDGEAKVDACKALFGIAKSLSTHPKTLPQGQDG